MMNNEVRHTLIDAKCARIILALQQLYGVSLEKATEVFYHSSYTPLIEEGVADLHCRSSLYLAQLIWEDYQEELNKA